MRGPEILARTMTVASRKGKSESAWQYHSRSDNHSKVACWTLLFDLLLECDSLREAAGAGRVGFGINHVVVGPINKTLDLVVTVVPPGRPQRRRPRFAEVADTLAIVLSPDDRQALAALPAIEMDESDDVSEVAIAIEAKACMTEHIKSLPRLHAEILATGYLAKKAVPRCITVSYSLVNAADRFVTPSGVGKTNIHRQPDDARRVVDMISRAVPTTTENRQIGYDAIGITVLDCRNDGTAVTVIESPSCAPARNEFTHYERMIRSVCSEYRSRFSR